MALLANTNIEHMNNDDIIWPHDSKGYITVNSLSIKLCEGPNCPDFSGNIIYKSEILMRAFFFSLVYH